MKRVLPWLLCIVLLVLAGCHRGSAGPHAGAAPDAVARSSGASPGGGAKSVVRTYTDSQGQPVTLYLGRGTGHRGDWGWAHIADKHIRGHWLDGGIITTFPEVFGTTSDDQVQDLMGSALAQARPRHERGRRLYQYRPPGRPGRVKVVVGGDGTIITAYPER